MNSSLSSTSTSLSDYILDTEVYSIPEPVTLILAAPWTSLPEADVQLVGKILTAVGQSLERVRILNHRDLTELPANTRVLLFGVPAPEGSNYYEVVTIKTTRCVYSDLPGNLDDLRKKSLWGALKSLFSAN